MTPSEIPLVSIPSAITTASADDDLRSQTTTPGSALAEAGGVPPKSCSEDLQDTDGVASGDVSPSPHVEDEALSFEGLGTAHTEIDDAAVEGTEKILLDLKIVTTGQLKKLRCLAQREALESVPDREASESFNLISAVANLDQAFPWLFTARSFLGLDAHMQCEVLCAYGIARHDVVKVLEKVREVLVRVDGVHSKSATNVYESSLTSILHSHKIADELQPRAHLYDPIRSALTPSTQTSETDWLSGALSTHYGGREPSGLELADCLFSDAAEPRRWPQKEWAYDVHSGGSASVISNKLKGHAFLEISGSEVSFDDAVKRLQRLSKYNGFIPSGLLTTYPKSMGLPESVSQLPLNLAPIANLSARKTAPHEMQLSFWVAFPIEGCSPLPESTTLHKSFIHRITHLHYAWFKSVTFKYNYEEGKVKEISDPQALFTMKQGIRSFIGFADQKNIKPIIYKEPTDAGESPP